MSATQPAKEAYQIASHETSCNLFFLSNFRCRRMLLWAFSVKKSVTVSWGIRNISKQNELTCFKKHWKKFSKQNFWELESYQSWSTANIPKLPKKDPKNLPTRCRPGQAETTKLVANDQKWQHWTKSIDIGCSFNEKANLQLHWYQYQ